MYTLLLLSYLCFSVHLGLCGGSSLLFPQRRGRYPPHSRVNTLCINTRFKDSHAEIAHSVDSEFICRFIRGSLGAPLTFTHSPERWMEL